MDGKLAYARSSYLVSLPVLAVCLLAGVLCAFFGLRVPACALLFLALLSALSRAWAFASVRDVRVRVEGASRGLFPGEQLEITLQVHNGKFLPVVWMELFCPLSKDLCLTPREVRPPDEWESAALASAGASTAQVGEKRFSFFLWYETQTYTAQWTANRRGLYSTAGWRLRTGDGFGLAQVEQPLPREESRQFAVYPKLVEVSPQLFLRSLWNADTGARGVMEDPTIIRSTRDYQTTDSLKHINWRLAARGLPLSVNVYEEILPKSVHFLFDGESFSGPEKHPDAMEESLSILASELVRLHRAQVGCGLSLCQGANSPAVNLFPGTDTEALLRALAGYQPSPDRREAGARGEVVLPQPPRFDEGPIYDWAQRVGRFYYIAYDISTLAERRLLRALGPARVTVLPYREAASFGEFELVCLRHLREEADHGA